MAAAVFLACALGAGCCGCDGVASPAARTHAPPGRPVAGARVAVVVLENHGPEVVRGGWLGRVAKRGGVATRAYGETHPSLGNYLAMISGSTQGISDDDVSDGPFAAPTLAGQLTKAGIPWRAYFDAMPSACYGLRSDTDTTGRYAKRHNPFLFFGDSVVGCRTRLLPGPPRPPLARFTWITPDLCEDMHDCDVSAGQRWMAATLPPLIKALGSHGVLFVTADEGTDGPGGGLIPLVALGAGVRPGARFAAKVDHRNLLATIEDVLGVPRLPSTRGLATLAPLLRKG